MNIWDIQWRKCKGIYTRLKIYMARNILHEDRVVHEMGNKGEVDIARNERILIRYKPEVCSMRENCVNERKHKKNPKSN